MQKMTATMKGIGEAYAKHDADAVGQAYTTDTLVKIAGMPDMNGRDAVVAHTKFGFGAFSDMKGGVTRMWVAPNVAALELVITGTNTGDLPGGKKATNRPMGITGLILDWFNDDGLIKEEHRYFDMGTEMKQLDPKADPKTFRPVVSAPAAATPEMHVSKGTSDEQALGTAAMVLYPAIDGHKEADFLAAINDDTTWDDSAYPQTMKGKGDAKTWFEMFTKAFPDTKTTGTPVVVADSFAVIEGSQTGTHKAPFMGIKTTGKPINLHYVDIVQMNADGKTIAHGWTYGNSAELLQELGVIPPMTGH
jgi:steroid delta-isomerase-like uncharacterized protein